MFFAIQIVAGLDLLSLSRTAVWIDWVCLFVSTVSSGDRGSEEKFLDLSL